ncbi:unnamed protein product [Ostreobium quekettii]|uniref:Bromo domain-containing protein n=1 Tax=Ostreobium quekettii TaxID=121088 RepID=A0A8S1JE55_9CHLO|nr:unnamed protein product [Ostreobium quekettii]|eukprot:evm.model.scf_1021.2 EVM.evm.TU.scf_1021.2   scf_1021:30397-38456(-)
MPLPADSGPSQRRDPSGVGEDGACPAGDGGPPGPDGRRGAALDGGRWLLRWELKRRVADITTEMEFIAREAHQLSQKRFVNPAAMSITVNEQERMMLHENHLKRLQDIVQRHCLPVLKNLINHKWAFPFNHPVDISKYHDYLNYVEKPMDLGTVKAHINSYRNPEELRVDVQTVFDNAEKYNPVGSDVKKMSDVLEEKFHERWNRVVVPKLEEEERALVNEEAALKQSKAGLMIMRAEGDVDHCCGVLLQRLEKLVERIQYCQCLAACACGVMSSKERVRLGWELATLPADHFQRAANLLMSRHPGLMATMKENTVQLDLEEMDALTLRQLQDFVRQCKKSRRRVAQSDQGSDINGGPAPRKRQRVENPTGASSPNVTLDSSRSSVRWPAVPLGIGLKPYKPELEACVPPECDSFRPAPSRMHSEPVEPGHLPPQRSVALPRTSTAPPAPVQSPRPSAAGVSTRRDDPPSAGPIAGEGSVLGMEKRLTTQMPVMSEAGRPLVERVLLRTHGSLVGSNNLASPAWGSRAGGEVVSETGRGPGLLNISGSAPLGTGMLHSAPLASPTSPTHVVQGKAAGLSIITSPRGGLSQGAVQRISGHSPQAGGAITIQSTPAPAMRPILGGGLLSGGLSLPPPSHSLTSSGLVRQLAMPTSKSVPLPMQVSVAPLSISLPFPTVGVQPMVPKHTVVSPGGISNLVHSSPISIPALPVLANSAGFPAPLLGGHAASLGSTVTSGAGNPPRSAQEDVRRWPGPMGKPPSTQDAGAGSGKDPPATAK